MPLIEEEVILGKKRKSHSPQKTRLRKKKAVKASKPIETEDIAISSSKASAPEPETAIVKPTKTTKKSQAQASPAKKDYFFTDHKFADLELSTYLKNSLATNGFERLTHVQVECIAPMLAGHDMCAKARTGSGKTLAFVLPALERIFRWDMRRHNGVGALVISPTRELAKQTLEVARKIAGDAIAVDIVMGGESIQREVQQLAKGVNLLVATPGRLLDHLRNTEGFRERGMKHCRMVILDEADELLKLGFQKELEAIFAELPRTPDERQVGMFSATLPEKLTTLKGLGLKKDAVKVDVTAGERVQTHVNFEQGFLICPIEHRFLLLFTFLKRHAKKKIMVFMSSCASVQFHADLLRYVKVPVMSISGQHKQSKRTEVYRKFTDCISGVLLATDVAARGLDIPDVDYVVQFDPPSTAESYIHRAGRACRGSEARKGRGLLILSENEVEFVRVLRAHGVPLLEFAFPMDNILNVQSHFERLISETIYLEKSAQTAFRAYLHAYDASPMKEVFDIRKLDFAKLAKSFGLLRAPRVHIMSMKKRKAKALRDEQKSQEEGSKFPPQRRRGPRGDKGPRRYR